MIPINWRQFEHNQTGKDISFESFCYQIAFSLYNNKGAFESYYNTPGSEFYLTLQSPIPGLNAQKGDFLGWQVKWWFDSEDNTSLTAKKREELIANFSTTIRFKPEVTHWIICTPGKFDQTSFNILVSQLRKLKANINIHHWNKDTFNNFRTAHFEMLEPIFHHYFNTFFIGFEQLEEFSKSRIQHLQGKFDSELYANSSNDEEIWEIIDLPSSFQTIKTKASVLADKVDRISRYSKIKHEDFPQYAERHLSGCTKLLDLCISTSKEIQSITAGNLTLDICKKLRNKIEKLDIKYRTIADVLNSEIKNNTHRIDGKKVEEDTYRYRDLFIDPVNEIRDEIFGIKADQEGEDDKKGLAQLLSKVFQHDVHIVSSAGYGKTNIVCNLCNTLLARKWPAILLLGSTFRGDALPQNKLVELLTWSKNYTFKQFIQAIENLGFVKGIKIPIIIDGLNESSPYHAIWNIHIKDIIAEVAKHDHVLLVTTCREMYIQSIFDTEEGQEVRNVIKLTGLKKRSLETAVRNYFRKYNIQPQTWHFDKELFQNPLLLKIFSEVNENSIGVSITLTNLYKSIDKYIDKIERKASEINSKVDPLLKKRIQEGIQNFCQLLWKKGVREISLSEFHSLVDPETRSLAGSLTERLLDEGLCFQKNLAGSEETVQFTYDAVAGYCIAARYLMPLLYYDNGKIANHQLKQEMEEKNYLADFDHPLMQDILIAQIHLFPEKFGVQLFEVVDHPRVLEEMCNNIDYVINKNDVQEKFARRLKSEGASSSLFRLLLERLFHTIYKKEVHGLGHFSLSVLMDLSQVEIDLLWTELARKNRYAIEDFLLSISRKYRWKKQNENDYSDDLYSAILGTTSIDKSVRSRATEVLYLVACQDPQKVIELLCQVASFNDVNLVESCIAAVCGTVLTVKRSEITVAALQAISTCFATRTKHVHINVIDYIETMIEFAREYHGLRDIPPVTLNKDIFNVSIDRKVLDGTRNLSDIPNNFDFDLYDFKKRQISSISNDGYEKNGIYSKQQCLAIILNHIKTKGFSQSVRNEMKKQFKEPVERTYPRTLQGSAQEYQEKYLWQSYYEFVGYLRLIGSIRKEKEMPRFRSNEIIFDPTFPKLPKKFQLITKVFFPKLETEIQEWIKEQKANYISEYYCHNLYTESDWVLLAANMNQVDERTDIRWQLYLDTFLIPSAKLKNFISNVRKDRFYYNQSGISFAFAGEIGWSGFAERPTDSYSLKPFNMEETVNTLTWSGWSEERDKVDSFRFFNATLAKKIDLRFSVEELGFVDDKKNPVTKIVWAENQKLFYIRKDILDRLIRIKRKKLIWHEHVSKFGNWKRSGDQDLEPSRQDTETIRQYQNNSESIIMQTFSNE